MQRTLLKTVKRLTKAKITDYVESGIIVPLHNIKNSSLAVSVLRRPFSESFHQQINIRLNQRFLSSQGFLSKAMSQNPTHACMCSLILDMK